MTTDQKKQAVARAALERVPADSIIGVGTGSTAGFFIEALAGVRSRVAGAVASSVATAGLLGEHGIRVVDLNDVEGLLALYVDGADEATRARRLIKGGGGALLREKIVATASREFVCIVDDSKLVEQLGGRPLPVEVIPMARRRVAERLARLGAHAVPREGFTTDNGNVILDVHGLVLDDPAAVEAELKQIAGVVESGLFCRRPADVLLVAGDGGVRVY